MKIDAFKVMDCSTAHVTEEDCNDLLERDDCPIAAYAFEYGHFVYIPQMDIGDNLRAAKAFGFSDAFVNLLKIASENGCKFIALDCDGMRYKDLPAFEW